MIWGNGRLIVGGGTVSVLVVLGVAVGASIGIEGYNSLGTVGMEPLTGFVSAYASTRELAPMIAAIGFAAQAGCRMTAEIGAMRISEEIDALEAQGIQPIPFVVTTRVIAGLVTIVPLYLLTLILSYVSCAVVVSVVSGQSAGTYDHYFSAFAAEGGGLRGDDHPRPRLSGVLRHRRSRRGRPGVGSGYPLQSHRRGDPGHDLDARSVGLRFRHQDFGVGEWLSSRIFPAARPAAPP